MLKIIILGSGNAFAHANQFQSCHYIEFEKTYSILLDCGPAILQAVQAAEVNVDNLEYLLISHLHGDHIAGIPFLLLHYKFIVQRFSKPLKIIGPPGLTKQLEQLLQGNYPNLLNKEEKLFEVYEIQLHEEKTLFDTITIKSYEANHFNNAYGYTIQKDDLKVIYSGDNEFKPDQLDEFTYGTVLIHELTTMSETRGGHTSWNLLKEYIDDILSKVGKVIAVHTGEDVRNEPESTFDGKIIRARDGSVFEFNEKGRMYQMVL